MAVRVNSAGQEAGPPAEEHYEHGSRCTCRLLAAAARAQPAAVDFNYCRLVLQKRWILECDHGSPEAEPKPTTREFPPHDGRDPVQAILVANA